jgi:hypothetical protein
VAGLGSAGYISSSQLVSTTAGLQFQFQTAGFLSTPNLVSTTQGLNTVIATSFSSFSTALASPLYFPSLQSTVAGLGSASYVSTATLFSTTLGIYNFVSTFIDPVELTSTIIGLGSASFVSTLGLQVRLQSTVEGLGSAGYASTSFVGNAISTFSSAIGASALPPTAFTSTVAGLGTAGYVSSLSLISTTQGIQTQFQTAGFLSTLNLTSTVRGLGSAGYLSSINIPFLSSFSLSTGQITTSTLYFIDINTQAQQLLLVSSGVLTLNGGAVAAGGGGGISTENLRSTVTGLGSASYISSLSLVSTTQGIQTQFQTSGFLSTPNLVSTVAGLGSAGYASTTFVGNAISTFSSAIGAAALPPTAFTSTVAGLGTAGYVSSLSLISTTAGLQNQFQTAGFLSTPNLVSTTQGLNTVIATSFSSFSTALASPLYFPSLQSTVAGLGSASYVSTASLFSTTTGIYNFVSTFIDPVELTSTIIGLGSASFVSSIGLQSRLQSTVEGLGSAGYASTTFVGNAISTFSTSIGGIVYMSTLTSTVAGLGTTGYVSSLSLISTTQGLQTQFQTAGFLSSLNLTSTVAGLGTAGYLSSINIPFLSSFIMSTSRINTSTLTFIDINTQAQQVLLVSSGTLTLNGNAIGGGGGAGAGLTASDFVVAGKLAADQSLTPNIDNNIQFVDDFDPQNWWNPATYFFTPTIAGYYLVSYQVWFNAGAVTNNQWNVQIQKNSSDTFTISQLQQTSTIGATMGTTKIIYMNGSSDNLRFRAYVGDAANTSAKAQQGTASGSGTFFTAALLTNGSDGGNLISTTAGLASIGYISTTQLVSTTVGLQFQFRTAGFISSLNLTSTVAGLGSAGYASTSFVGNAISTFSTAIGASALPPTAFTSTVAGLGSAGYISTASLISTTAGLQIQFQTAGFLSTANLISTVTGLGSAGYASTSYVLQQISSFSTALGSVGAGNLTTANLTSTVQGLGSASYISSSQLISTVAGIGSGSGLTQTVLTSTVIGLGTIGYISTPGGGGGIQTSNLTSTVQGLGTAGYASTAQSQYSLFTVRAGTSYTGEPWTEQLMSLSNIGLFNAPVYLEPDNITLRVSTATNALLRVSYMTGGNNTTLTTPRPTITMALSTPTDISYFPSVENFEGGGGSVSFIQSFDSASRLLFYMRGLSNYTFGTIDGNLYRMTFELVGQTQTLNVLSNISSLSSIINNLYTQNTRVTTELIVDRSSITTSAFAVNLLANDVNVRNSTTTFSMYADTTRTLNSSIARAVHTDYLRVMSNAIIGCNSVVIRDDTVFASSVQVSTVNILDQSTMRFVPLSISSGSIYLNNVLASAGGGGGGGGGGGTGGSTLSSLFVGSSSNQNFIKFWGQIGEYNNTAIVQQSTGGGTTEFLFFEGSSINDQFRFQTTGNIRFETGVAGPRDVNTANQLATPTMIINSSSNVGINTANPSFNLDVAGSGRFQTLMSTVSVFSGALYLGVFFA